MPRGKFSEETKKRMSESAKKRVHRGRQLGSIRLDKDGYKMLKVSEKSWKPLQVYLYEKLTGDTVAKNEKVIFLDKCKENFFIDNLIKVTNAELCVINRWFPLGENAEENKTKILLAKIQYRRHEKARELGLCDDMGDIKSEKIESQIRWNRKHKEYFKIKQREYYQRKKNDPVWVAEYNRKQRERRARIKGGSK